MGKAQSVAVMTGKKTRKTKASKPVAKVAPATRVHSVADEIADRCGSEIAAVADTLIGWQKDCPSRNGWRQDTLQHLMERLEDGLSTVQEMIDELGEETLLGVEYVEGDGE
ncbi:hypothetical protein [Anatilimnocola floriformis]|uniref:hypothetical protein n=1 Tax=Anatilimnocola floriformis TaxID=2948575 RepID=UPI0020C432E0|nr:hypothetical protein [Anatilimnocola floriformis]